jgi:hypothetical protein
MCWDYQILYVDFSFHNTTKFFKNITLHIKLENPPHRVGLQTSDLLIRMNIWGVIIRIVAKFLDFMLLEDSIVSHIDIKTHKFPKF